MFFVLLEISIPRHVKVSDQKLLDIKGFLKLEIH